MQLNYKDIGMRIRKERKALSMSQQTLAELVDLQPNTISHIERGATTVQLQSLINIANALHVPIERLLCGVTVASEQALRGILADVLNDCSAEEMRVIVDMCDNLKRSLRKNMERK
ncbi:helix-turn-helix transcriptional regulator [Anaerotruncus colihominis]|jgi:transcriptional regulator with XRE-family HTH domain|uniref:XRE family transcriptional regulator n=1 Tax=Anaerotruncus colihominis TaxID=169435 RepID=A0A845RKA2_9FIRM|nr:helix-turn-helix transcriptional regulator [Anaerotruncus colihominis]NBI80436.1 XRE family transcriptional regulator [Anaerotruncus colihominis]